MVCHYDKMRYCVEIILMPGIREVFNRNSLIAHLWGGGTAHSVFYVNGIPLRYSVGGPETKIGIY